MEVSTEDVDSGMLRGQEQVEIETKIDSESQLTLCCVLPEAFGIQERPNSVVHIAQGRRSLGQTCVEDTMCNWCYREARAKKRHEPANILRATPIWFLPPMPRRDRYITFTIGSHSM